GRLWDAGKNVAVLDRAAARTAVPVHAAGAVAAPGGRPASFAHLRLLGSVDEATLGDWLGRRPVFVSAARYEPFGLAVLEAAAAGCALVLSDIPSFRELWADAAVFVAPDDDRGFAAAIDGLVGDAGRRQAMGAAAAARAARYTPAAAAAAMAAIYAGLVAAPGLSAHAA
ncbi:MAG: glycosyltransferase, partial [Janthinobacterium lividum]